MVTQGTWFAATNTMGSSACDPRDAHRETISGIPYRYVLLAEIAAGCQDIRQAVKLIEMAFVAYDAVQDNQAPIGSCAVEEERDRDS